jgi:hypothetical protein
VAALAYLLPWTKIPVCRSQFAVSSLVMLGGALACVVAYGRPTYPLHYMIAGWMLFIPPAIMQIIVFASLDRAYRICDSGIPDEPDLAVPVQNR